MELIGSKNNAEGLEAFKPNAVKHSREFITLLGLAGGYSAGGDHK